MEVSTKAIGFLRFSVWIQAIAQSSPDVGCFSFEGSFPDYFPVWEAGQACHPGETDYWLYVTRLWFNHNRKLQSNLIRWNMWSRYQPTDRQIYKMELILAPTSLLAYSIFHTSNIRSMSISLSVSFGQRFQKIFNIPWCTNAPWGCRSFCRKSRCAA